MLGQHPLEHFREQVDIIAAAGATIPDTYTAIHTRWVDYLETLNPAGQQLIDAIIDPNIDADLDMLRALALAEKAPATDKADLSNQMRGPVLLALRQAYEPQAAANYRLLADRFTTTATDFTKAVRTIDPDSSAEQMATQPDKARKAWADASILALQLDQQIPTLATAAALAGLRINGNDAHLGLTCDTTGLHRRRVWEAWETDTGRTTKWGALVTLGVTLRAASLDEYEHYRRPAPIEVKYVRSGGQYAGSVRVEVDPEDELV
ncbi:hypothetical protein ACFWCF_24830 [Rhodococcus sp. NPDC060090]|uniref:hypothetical protein n=1 Tax=Rhodococcus sp. NPDC060090 TaxID=3347056 RepID=UPI003653328D